MKLAKRVFPTPKQQEVYRFLVDFIKQNNYSPTQKEIARGINISEKSISCITRYLDELEKLNWVTRVPGTERSVVPTSMVSEVEIPGRDIHVANRNA